MSSSTVYFLLLNAAINGLTAYAAGKAWTETEHHGGWRYDLAWLSAAVSAIGFTGCYLTILALFCVGKGYISEDIVVLLLNLDYLMLVPGAIAMGVTLMLAGWAREYRRLLVPDEYHVSDTPRTASGGWFDFPIFFGWGGDSGGGSGSSGGDGGDSSGDGCGIGTILMVFVLALFAVFGGIVTTAAIINWTANPPLPAQ